jgi:hypothetical protein
MDEKAPPAIGFGGPLPAGTTPCAPSSRRSSLSPSDRTGRRRDSPACIVVEVPPWHRAILNFIEVGAALTLCGDKNTPFPKEISTISVILSQIARIEIVKIWKFFIIFLLFLVG